MKTNKKNEVTLDELAAMVANGFNDMQTRMDERFESVDKKFKSVDKRFDGMDKRFESVDKRFESIESTLNSFRSEFNDFRSEVRSEFKTLWREVDNINARLDRIEKNKAEELELITGDLITLKSKVASLEQKVNKFKLAS